MTSEELIQEIEQILKSTDREIQIKILRALIRYQNIDGLDLEEVLGQELELENSKESP